VAGTAEPVVVVGKSGRGVAAACMQELAIAQTSTESIDVGARAQAMGTVPSPRPAPGPLVKPPSYRPDRPHPRLKCCLSFVHPRADYPSHRPECPYFPTRRPRCPHPIPDRKANLIAHAEIVRENNCVRRPRCSNIRGPTTNIRAVFQPRCAHGAQGKSVGLSWTRLECAFRAKPCSTCSPRCLQVWLYKLAAPFLPMATLPGLSVQLHLKTARHAALQTD
jgi:hypothetical protein